MPNAEDFYRLNKALEIASWLVGGGRHSAEAATANDVGWAITMQTLRNFGADFEWDYLPSEKTRREVVRIMEMFEERAAVCQAAHTLSQTLAKDRLREKVVSIAANAEPEPQDEDIDNCPGCHMPLVVCQC